MRLYENIHVENTEDVIQKLKTSAKAGLSAGEAKSRLAEYGPNELEERVKKPAWKMLLGQFMETMVVILIIAAVISGFLGKEIETIAIAAIVVLFAILGFVQEYRAEKAMAALKQLTVPFVRVIRDGVTDEISAKTLVPGDIIVLEAGNIVPADVRFIETVSLKIQEAALTGESDPVDKRSQAIGKADTSLGDRFNMAYMGTIITMGRGKAVVVRTGMHTEIGKIANLIQDVEKGKTPLQNKLDQLGKWLAIAGGIAAGVILVVGLLQGELLSDMFLVGISVAVAVIPEGLPAVVTITLALGAQKMLKRNALIRKLPAVETLGSVTVICSDKTGTLTENKMTVTTLEATEVSLRAFPSEGIEFPNIQLNLLIGLLCNDADIRVNEDSKTVIGEPTEAALVDAALKVGMIKQEFELKFPRVGEVPFDSDRMRMTTVHKFSGTEVTIPQLTALGQTEHVAFMKGAVDSLLKISNYVKTKEGVEPLSEQWVSRIKNTHDELASHGIRILGLAYRELKGTYQVNDSVTIEAEAVFSGMVGLMDPPRASVKADVKKCIQAGIRPVMITGDYPLTAMAIARELGLPTEAGYLTSEHLSAMSDKELEEKVKQVSVFARVSPQDKLKIVTAFQNLGEVVAMTGDGVNDSPALKKADIGVAMGITGTDVSKEASDMVLLDDNFATIVTAVEEGRAIFDNLVRFIKFSLGGNLGKVLVMLFAPFIGISIALSPLQLLYLNLLTDGLMGLGLGMEPSEKNNMQRPPRSVKDPVLNKPAVIHVTWTGFLIGAISLAVGFFYFNPAQADDPYWQTMVFATLGFTQIGHALGLRASGYSVFSLTSNIVFTIVIALTLILQLVVIYVPFFGVFFSLAPLAFTDLTLSVSLGLFVLVCVQLERRWLSKG
ncbi:MAG: cation-translocating P-type ATPase [Cyclobacteriaceae bacterium]|nr:cation-translocating P-type ATPase [Cyclobacteriaceae bacterium]UYN86786.1 MAG: cation-translocating P-type ATPase [Cyclobacteriaceae bacterium]